MTSLRTLDTLDAEGLLNGSTVLVRCDFNVPLEGSGADRSITDDGRIQAALPTINELLGHGCVVVVLSHLGRPRGGPDSDLSTNIVARRLAELVDSPVVHCAAVSGSDLDSLVASVDAPAVVVTENVRFDPRETSNESSVRMSLAGEWAKVASVYIDDGFGVVHRQQASVSEIAELIPAAAGRLVEREVSVFRRVLDEPDRPLTVVLGGSKVSDKLGVIENLLPHVDRLVIGGGMCFTFLAASGVDIGRSLVEPDRLADVRDILAACRDRSVDVHLPSDIVVAGEISANASVSTVRTTDGVPPDLMGLDIGPTTAGEFAAVIADSGTVVWNGPMGVFEVEPFAAGTRTVAQALSSMAGFSVVGGGDSAAAVRLLGIEESSIDHISTGGGASLEFLEGKSLPGLLVLAESQSGQESQEDVGNG